MVKTRTPDGTHSPGNILTSSLSCPSLWCINLQYLFGSEANRRNSCWWGPKKLDMSFKNFKVKRRYTCCLWSRLQFYTRIIMFFLSLIDEFSLLPQKIEKLISMLLSSYALYSKSFGSIHHGHPWSMFMACLFFHVVSCGKVVPASRSSTLPMFGWSLEVRK